MNAFWATRITLSNNATPGHRQFVEISRVAEDFAAKGVLTMRQLELLQYASDQLLRDYGVTDVTQGGMPEFQRAWFKAAECVRDKLLSRLQNHRSEIMLLWNRIQTTEVTQGKHTI